MKTIYAIPGLGTTSELLQNISVPSYELKVLDWPEPVKAMSMEEYAAGFLPLIDQSAPVTLLGVSFGGMLCAELAEKIKVNKVFLVSSCKNRNEFPWSLRLLKTIPAYRLFSDKMVRLLAKTKRKFLGFEKSFEPVFFEMISRMPDRYFSQSIHCIVTWNRRANTTPFIRIHGTSDKLLRYKGTEKAYEIQDGTHSMVLARAGEINAILNQELNG